MMVPSRLLVPAIPLLLPAAPAAAASFDCAAAQTPFEQAICSVPELSRADEVLAKAFATASGGLTRESADLLRADQRNWLDYARRACTEDARPLTTGSYDEMGASCLVEKFQSRSRALEQSRMIDGHRFFIKGIYAAMPDPNEVDNPDSYWKVGTQELVFPLLDMDEPLAETFNEYSHARADGLSQVAISPDTSDFDGSADTSVGVTVKEIAGANRITLEVSNYWYGHGAAHGNYSLTYLHYFVPEEREVVAGDVFAGADWQDVLAEAAWTQLQAQHGEWLQIDGVADIADIVIDPERWDFSSPYGLIVQFQPYEIAAYAYGAPTVTIPWTDLGEIGAETQDAVRYGW